MYFCNATSFVEHQAATDTTTGRTENRGCPLTSTPLTIMGNSPSSHSSYAANDYELVIKCSKHLEHYLETEFRATGQGLHEKVSSVESRLPSKLVKDLRYLATIRNKLIHDVKMDCIPDRKVFVEVYERCLGALQELKARRNQGKKDSNNTACVIT
jgi:hypothetical protein